MISPNPYLPIATPDRTAAAWALVEHVSPSLAGSIRAPTLAAIRAFLAEVSATGFFLDTIAQDIEPLLSSLEDQPHAYHRAILAMQRMRDWGSQNDPVSTGSTFDPFGLALLVEGELRKLSQPVPVQPVQGDLFDEGEVGEMPCFAEEQFRRVIAGEVCVEARQW